MKLAPRGCRPSFSLVDKPIDFGKDAARPSGAPEAGGATSRGSSFGGRTYVASLWRMLARIARDLEATAYRRLAEMEAKRGTHGPGSPKRVKAARQPPAKVT